MAMFKRVAGKATKVNKQEAEEMVRKARQDRHADAVLNDEVEYEQPRPNPKSKAKPV